MSRLDPLLKTLAAAPPAQIDTAMTKRLAMLPGSTDEIVASELKDIVELCNQKSLASPFAIEMLEQAILVAETRD